MVTGRGLGHTGGTTDKLETIPGYRCDLSNEQFHSIISQCNCFIGTQTNDVAPADKRIYALRDISETVKDITLITASILSKKFAEGLNGLTMVENIRFLK
jgi:thymidine phosphorylase